MTQSAVDHRQKEPVAGAGLDDLVRSIEALEGFLQAADPEKDRAHVPLVAGRPPGGPLGDLDQAWSIGDRLGGEAARVGHANGGGGIVDRLEPLQHPGTGGSVARHVTRQKPSDGQPLVERRDVGMLLDRSGVVVGRRPAPKATTGIEFPTLQDDRYVLCGSPARPRRTRPRPPPTASAPGSSARGPSARDRSGLVQLLLGRSLRWTSAPRQPFATLEPGRVVEDLDEALLLVEPQASHHLNPGGHALQLVRQIRRDGKEA